MNSGSPCVQQLLHPVASRWAYCTAEFGFMESSSISKSIKSKKKLLLAIWRSGWPEAKPNACTGQIITQKTWSCSFLTQMCDEKWNPPLPFQQSSWASKQLTMHVAAVLFFAISSFFIDFFLIIRGKLAIMINCRGSYVLNWSISKVFVSDTIQWCINHRDWDKLPLWIHYGTELKTSLICPH